MFELWTFAPVSERMRVARQGDFAARLGVVETYLSGLRTRISYRIHLATEASVLLSLSRVRHIKHHRTYIGTVIVETGGGILLHSNANVQTWLTQVDARQRLKLGPSSPVMECDSD
jgi:hypothetical protein